MVLTRMVSMEDIPAFNGGAMPASPFLCLQGHHWLAIEDIPACNGGAMPASSQSACTSPLVDDGRHSRL